jgi:hypothetical protein
LRRIAYIDLPLPAATTLYFAKRLMGDVSGARLSKIVVIKWLLDFGMLAGEVVGSFSRVGRRGSSPGRALPDAPRQRSNA